MQGAGRRGRRTSWSSGRSEGVTSDRLASCTAALAWPARAWRLQRCWDLAGCSPWPGWSLPRSCCQCSGAAQRRDLCHTPCSLHSSTCVQERVLVRQTTSTGPRPACTVDSGPRCGDSGAAAAVAAARTMLARALSGAALWGSHNERRPRAPPCTLPRALDSACGSQHSLRSCERSRCKALTYGEDPREVGGLHWHSKGKTLLRENSALLIR